ncbi:hypothetical protein N9948_01000 [bacterium]|nr:hypothetical protein [bacterium]
MSEEDKNYKVKYADTSEIYPEENENFFLEKITSYKQKTIPQKCGYRETCIIWTSSTPEAEVSLIEQQCPYFLKRVSKSYLTQEALEADKDSNKNIEIHCTLPNSLEFLT